MSMNKVILEHNYAHLCMYGLLLSKIIAELSSSNRDYIYSLKCLYSIYLQKKFSKP